MGNNGDRIIWNPLGPGHSSTGRVNQALGPDHGNGYPPAFQSDCVDHTGRRARPSVSYTRKHGIRFLRNDLIKELFRRYVANIGFLEEGDNLELVFLF